MRIMKTMAWMLLLTLWVTPVLAEDSSSELSIEEAVELMSEYSTSLEIAELNWEIAQLDNQKALANNLMSDSRLSEMQAELNLAKANNSYQGALFSNSLNVFQLYTDAQAASRNVTIRELELLVAEHDYRIILEKIRIGDVGRLDELRELNALESARLNARSAQHSYEETMRALGKVVGMEGEELLLTSELTLPKLTLDLDESIELAFTNDFGIFEGEFNLEVQVKQLERQRVEGTPPIDLQRAELAMKVSELNLKQAKENLEESVTSAHHNLQQLLASYEGAVRDHEIAEDSWEISKRQAEAGLITDMQLVGAELSLLRAVNSQQNAKVSYIVSFLQFNRSLGLDGDFE